MRFSVQSNAVGEKKTSNGDRSDRRAFVFANCLLAFPIATGFGQCSSRRDENGRGGPEAFTED